MLSELQESATHQLKNKLASIQAFARIALDEQNTKEKPHDKALDFLEEIENLAREALALLQQLLEAQRLETDLTIRKKFCNVTALVQKIVAVNQGLALAKDITLHPPSSMPCYAEMDEDRLGEALDNLISNAIKYSPPHTSVWVAVHSNPKHPKVVRIEVRDEGGGLTRNDRTNLFTKYRRLSAQPTGDESSTGLGLAITKRIVELHGGDLSADSKGPNQGSVFRIHLPTNIRTPMCESV